MHFRWKPKNLSPVSLATRKRTSRVLYFSNRMHLAYLNGVLLKGKAWRSFRYGFLLLHVQWKFQMKTTTKKKSSCGEGEVTRGDETKLSDTFLRRKSLFEAELRIGVSRVSAKASHARSRDLNSCVKGDFFLFRCVVVNFHAREKSGYCWCRKRWNNGHSV